MKQQSNISTQTYTKIPTLYKRYMKLGEACPNNKWRKFANQIIMGEFTDPVHEYLKNCLWEGYSKIDGTNSKIIFYPSSGKIIVGGKTDKANSQHGQFEFLQEIADRIKPILEELYPKENARFVQAKNSEANVPTYFNDAQTDEIIPYEDGLYYTELVEKPVYIYGEYFGKGIQKCGGRYSDDNDFMVFDIDAQGWWLPKDMRDEMCEKLGLKQVPFIGVDTLDGFENMVTKGFETRVPKVKDPSLIEEGIVARPIVPLLNSRGNRIIVKIKYGDYSKYAETRKEFTDEEFNEFNEWYHKNIEPVQ